MLPRHTEGPLASLRAPGRPPKLATAPSHGLLCDPQTHTRHLENKSGCLGPLFFPTRKSPRPPGGPLPLPGSSKESTGTGRGSPAPQLSSPTPTLPFVSARVQYFHFWWSSWRRRPRSCWQLGKWKDAVERTRPVAKAHVGKAQPWKLEPEATSNPSLQGRKGQNRQPFPGPPALPPSRWFFSLICVDFSPLLFSSHPLCPCVRGQRGPPPWLKLAKARLM